MRFQESIFRRVLLMMILISLLAGVMVLGVNIYQESSLIKNFLIEENQLVAKLASRAIETGSLTRLWPFELLKHITESEDILFWWVVDPSGRIKLSDDVKMENKIIINPSLDSQEALIKDSLYYKTNEKIKLIIQPMLIGGYDQPSYFYLGVSLNRIFLMQRQAIIGSIGLFFLIIIFAIFISYYVSKSFTEPLDFLMEGVQYISQGDLEHQIKVLSKDEFGRLAIAFNEMTVKIKETRERDKLINKIKTEFITIAAHQLRTPLTAIKWTIKMILDGDAGKLNEGQKDILLKGYKSNERIIRLINDLLNVSRIEEGRFGLVFKKNSFEDLLDEALKTEENLILTRNISLIVNKPKKIPEVYMDIEKMGIALATILDNAVKYTPEFGKIEVKVSVLEDKINLFIKDNGVGIPKEEQDRLFSKFFRGSNVMRMQTEGTGLGLFIMKNIIEKHNGEIKIKSEEGKGTEVKIILPINN